jgi:hypothetical protein
MLLLGCAATAAAAAAATATTPVDAAVAPTIRLRRDIHSHTISQHGFCSTAQVAAAADTAAAAAKQVAAGQACDAVDVRTLQHAAAAAPKFNTVSTAQVKMIVIDQQVRHTRQAVWNL